MPPKRVKGHENCCSVWTVNWAAQPRLTDKVWFDAPLVADSEGAAAVEAAALVEGTEGADRAWLAAGLEGAYPIDDSGDFAGLLLGPRVALCRGAFDAIAVGIDAVTGVTTASAADMTAAARWCWALRPAWSLGVPAQAVTPRATAATAVTSVMVAIHCLRPLPAPSLIRLLHHSGEGQGYPHNGHIFAVFINLNGAHYLRMSKKDLVEAAVEFYLNARQEELEAVGGAEEDD